MYGRWTTYVYLSCVCLTRDSAVTVFLCIFDTKVQISRVNFPFFDCECNMEKGIIYEEFTAVYGLKLHVRNKISIVKSSAALTNYFGFEINKIV